MSDRPQIQPKCPHCGETRKHAEWRGSSFRCRNWRCRKAFYPTGEQATRSIGMKRWFAQQTPEQRRAVMHHAVEANCQMLQDTRDRANEIQRNAFMARTFPSFSLLAVVQSAMTAIGLTGDAVEITRLVAWYAGVWLADGIANKLHHIAQIPEETQMIAKFGEVVTKADLHLIRKDPPLGGKSTVPWWYFSTSETSTFEDRNDPTNNLLHIVLSKLGVQSHNARPGRYCDKEWPEVIHGMPREHQLQILAGLIDGDGSRLSNQLYVGQKRRRIAEGVEHLCWQLGYSTLAHYDVPKLKPSGKPTTFCTVAINAPMATPGILHEIPIVIDRKKC
jgi:hypothetical protein